MPTLKKFTDATARNAKATGKAFKRTVGDGLYLFVTGQGAKSWRYDYRMNGRRETVVLGAYPDKLSFEQAKAEHLKARALVANGQSPAERKASDKAATRAAVDNTLQSVADAWYAEKGPKRSATWRDNLRRWLDRDVYPVLGGRPIGTITEDDIRRLMRSMTEVREITDKAGRKWKTGGPKTAHHMRQALGQVFDHARRKKLVVGNPARDARDEIELPEAKHHRPLAPSEIPSFLSEVDRYPGRPETRLAIRLLMLCFPRKMELCAARWAEFELAEPATATWRIPAERMKSKNPHIVPLSTQAQTCLVELQAISGTSGFVFPSLSDPGTHLSPSALNAAFMRMGFKGRVTPHGLRTTASTLLNEQGFDRDAIELQLAHIERDEVRAAYNHSDKLPERRRMLQAWADYLDALCVRANIHPIRRIA